jgi:hypothetical protein
MSQVGKGFFMSNILMEEEKDDDFLNIRRCSGVTRLFHGTIFGRPK